MSIHYEHGIVAGEFEDLEEVMALAVKRGFRPMTIGSEVGSKTDLVKAFLKVGDINVAFTDPTTTDPVDGPQSGLYWDYWDDRTSLPMGDGAGGWASTPAAALDALIDDMVSRGYVTEALIGQGITTRVSEAEWREVDEEDGDQGDFGLLPEALCQCGHRMAEHQTGVGPWTGFCYDLECKCEEPIRELDAAIVAVAAEVLAETMERQS